MPRIKDERPCELFRRTAYRAPCGASSSVVPCEHVRPRNLKSDERAWKEGEPSSRYEYQSVSYQTAGRLQTMRPVRALSGLLREPRAKGACWVCHLDRR